MNKKIYLLLSVLLAWSFNLKAQTAQIESITATPGDNVTFDITVAGFPSNVGAISLFIGYDPSVLTFSGTTSGTISGYFANNMAGTNQVGIQWTNPTGQAIDGILLTLNFQYSQLGGECDLTFDAGCEFADILLNTISVGFTPGHIGPAATVATLTIPDVAATTGPVSVPITAAGFPTNVGAITLFIQYDNTVLTFANTTPGTIMGYFANASNGVIGISYTNTGGIGIDGTLLTLNFQYSNGTSDLTFNPGCEIVEVDFDPIITSYNSGSVYPLAANQTMTLEDVTGIPGNPVSVDITAAGFDANYDVAAITLNIGFDPNNLTFINISNGTISGAYANVIAPGLLGITWTDASGDDIDGVLLSLNFMYNIGEGDISFEGGCEVSNIDLSTIPTSYYDGSISQGTTTATATLPKKVGVIGQPVSFPILVSDFPNNVGAISLFISYNSSVLQFNGTTPGTLTNYFANNMPAWPMVGIQWSLPGGFDISPNGEDTLLLLNFTYLGGYCDVAFSAGCEFAENDLDPIPVSYFNGGIIMGTKIDVTAILEGPFNGTDMNTTLNSSSYLPLAQPYSGGPWNYAGTENVAAIPSADVVEWILVELRETDGGAAAATSGTAIAQQAAFLLKNGSIVTLDGTNDVLFNLAVNDDLYVVIYHRTHLGMMSATALTSNINGGYEVFSYDFTDGQSKAYNNGQKALAGGKFGMYAADGDANGDINLSDFIDVWVVQFGSLGYFAGDFDLNGDVNLSDFIDFWVPNFGKLTQIP